MKRGRQRQHWPRGLRETRPGYFSWEHPDGRHLAIGRVDLATAINEALAANRLVAQQKPTLIERLTGGANTIEQLMEKMRAPKTENTAKTLRSLDRKIVRALGNTPVASIGTARLAQIVEAEADEGKMRSAQALRSRLVSLFKRAQELGWVEGNPATPIGNPEFKTKRERLTLETFQAVYQRAPEVAEWLQAAMRWAIVTAADRSTIATMQRAMVKGDDLEYRRSKTGAVIAVPLKLKQEALGWTLKDLTDERTGVVTPWYIHHQRAWGNAPIGSPVHPDRISHAFAEARELAGLPSENGVTFHEIRSLAVRLYKAQGNVDVQALCGHAHEKMTAVYADPRGVEAIRVKVG